MALTILLVFVLLALGLGLTLPMFIVLTGTAFIAFAATTSIPLSILPQRVFAGLESFPLLAIPFFIFAANIMGKGGLSARLVSVHPDARRPSPGRSRHHGGGHVRAVRRDHRARAHRRSSRSAASSTPPSSRRATRSASRSAWSPAPALLGMIIPPSNAMIVYGAVAGASIGALFMSGIGAGAVFALVYSTYCYGWAKWNRFPAAPRASLREIWQTTRDVVWGLGMPAIILGGIYGGVFTATEAAAVSVVYAAFVCMVVYRQLDLKGLWEVCLDSALASARILIMVGAASLFSWLLTVTGITTAIAQPFAELKQSPDMVLLAANVLFLVAGMFIDVFSNILILVPILIGTVTAAGIGPVHFGIVTSVNVDIGNITPPFGLNLFVASGTFDKPYMTVVRAVLPWLGLALLSLAIITYFPELSLWLPKQMYPGVR